MRAAGATLVPALSEDGPQSWRQAMMRDCERNAFQETASAVKCHDTGESNEEGDVENEEAGLGGAYNAMGRYLLLALVLL